MRNTHPRGCSPLALPQTGLCSSKAHNPLAHLAYARSGTHTPAEVGPCLFDTQVGGSNTILDTSNCQDGPGRGRVHGARRRRCQECCTAHQLRQPAPRVGVGVGCPHVAAAGHCATGAGRWTRGGRSGRRRSTRPCCSARPALADAAQPKHLQTPQTPRRTRPLSLHPRCAAARPSAKCFEEQWYSGPPLPGPRCFGALCPSRRSSPVRGRLVLSASQKRDPFTKYQ